MEFKDKMERKKTILREGARGGEKVIIQMAFF